MPGLQERLMESAWPGRSAWPGPHFTSSCPGPTSESTATAPAGSSGSPQSPGPQIMEI